MHEIGYAEFLAHTGMMQIQHTQQIIQIKNVASTNAQRQIFERDAVTLARYNQPYTDFNHEFNGQRSSWQRFQGHGKECSAPRNQLSTVRVATGNLQA